MGGSARMEQEQQIFRKKSLDKISSPEQLKDYLHVTNPSVWILLAAVLLLLISLLVWSDFAVIENQAAGTASIDSGVITLHFDEPEQAKNIETGMEITIGGVTAPITYTGTDSGGNAIVGVDAALPNGNYSFLITYDMTKVIKLLFN